MKKTIPLVVCFCFLSSAAFAAFGIFQAGRPSVVNSFLLLENGSFLLLEDGSKLILE